MKTILFTIAIVLLSNLTFSQARIGYNYNYEVKFDVSVFSNEEPKNTVREFVDYIFQEQNEKFNIQTRYSEDGTLFISSNCTISECSIEAFFHEKNSVLLSFEQKPTNYKKGFSFANVAQY